MISYLSIRNFGLFSHVRLELGAGLTVFTGETGAGKSMLVDAVMACLGQRTSKDLLRSGEERAVIELLASPPPGISPGPQDPLYDLLTGADEVVLQKDILAERSYLRLNGRLATSAMAQDLGSRLVDIHGQQEHHSLLRPQTYLNLLDSLGKEDTGPLRQSWSELYARRHSLRTRMDELGKGGRARQHEIDLLAFQVEEIAGAKLKVGEEEELRQEYTVLSSQEELVELASLAYESLYGGGRSASENLDLAVSALRKVSAIDPSVSPVLEATREVSFGLEAALDLVRDYRRRLVVDPGRLRVVSERLDLIGRMKSKYGETVEEVFRFAESAKTMLDQLTNADETLQRMHVEMESVERDMASIGDRLTELRRQIAGVMAERVTDSLQELGMAGARFIVELDQDSEPGPYGFDKVSFLFSANPGEPPLPVNRVASGGELSRLMLAIKSHMEAVDPVPTVIFDEIDAGIGGKAGQAVAERLWNLGRTHQILCVTHLASIAALADTHFLVSKEEKDGRTSAIVRRVSGDERVLEIARMLSGVDLKISVEHARELIQAGEDFKRGDVQSGRR